MEYKQTEDPRVSANVKITIESMAQMIMVMWFINGLQQPNVK